MLRSFYPSTVPALLLLGIVLTSCGADPRPSPKAGIPVISLAEAQTGASRVEAHCTIAEECSPSVAMLASAHAESIGYCSAFLIAPDILATNSHCIPDDLKAAGSNCQGRIWASFPGVGSLAAQKAECAQVLSASAIDHTGTRPDYAFFKLRQAIARPALKISHEGFHDGETYLITKVDPVLLGKIPSGYLHQITCKAVHGTLAYPTFSHADDPVLVFADCPIIHGNSGSPILDSLGQVRGLIHATINRDSGPIMELKQRNRPPESSLALLNLGTNFSCVATAIDGFEPSGHPHCTEIPSLLTVKNEKLQKEFSSQLGSVTDAFTAENGIRWKFEVAGGKKVRLAPSCIHDRALLFRSGKSLQIPVWQFTSAGVNRYLQLHYTVNPHPASWVGATLHYDPRDTGHGEVSRATLSLAPDNRDVTANGGLKHYSLVDCDTGT